MLFLCTDEIIVIASPFLIGKPYWHTNWFILMVILTLGGLMVFFICYFLDKISKGSARRFRKK